MPKNLSILGVYSNRGQIDFVNVTWVSLPVSDYFVF